MRPLLQSIIHTLSTEYRFGIIPKNTGLAWHHLPVFFVLVCRVHFSRMENHFKHTRTYFYLLSAQLFAPIASVEYTPNSVLPALSPLDSTHTCQNFGRSAWYNTFAQSWRPFEVRAP